MKTRADKWVYIEDLEIKQRRSPAGDNRDNYTRSPSSTAATIGKQPTLRLWTSKKTLTTEKLRWAEHFSEVLNKPPTTTDAEVHDPDADLNINTVQPEKEKILTAIKSFKNGKAPGQDSFKAELFKVDPELAAQIVQPLFAALWEKKQQPDKRTEDVIKIPKKGALNCNSWRGITLLSPAKP